MDKEDLDFQFKMAEDGSISNFFKTWGDMVVEKHGPKSDLSELVDDKEKEG